MNRIWCNLALGAMLVLLVLIAYRPAFSAGWIWDDDSYISNDANLRNADGLKRIWTEPIASPQYYPLTFTSFWLEEHLFGPSPESFHRDNIFLHAASVLLLWIILRKLDVPAAWLIAAIWGVHPVNVESIAWASERKNILSGFFYLLAALMFLRWVTPPPVPESIPENRVVSGPEFRGEDAPAHLRIGVLRYILSLFFFTLALLAKTVAATFPGAMLLLIWWKRGIHRRDWLLAAPFVLLALPLSWVTSHLEHTHVGASGPEFAFSILDRCKIAAHDAWFYAAKDLCPINLSFIYPKWSLGNSQFFYIAALLAALGLLWWLRRFLGRGVMVGPLFFLGTLLPALGFVNVYPMRFSFVADHFQYLASIGMIGGVIALMGYRGWFAKRPSGRITASALLATLSLLTYHRAGTFASSFSLWNDALAKNPDSWMVRTNTGVMLLGRAQRDLKANRIGDAEREFSGAELQLEQAIRIRGDIVEPWLDLAQVEKVQGKYDLAERSLRRALAINYNNAEVHFQLGAVLVPAGKIKQGITEYRIAVAQNPRHVPAWVNLGVALDMQGKTQEAAAADRKALAIDPDSVFAHVNLGNALLKLHYRQEAGEQFREALALEPNFSPALEGLKACLAVQPK